MEALTAEELENRLTRKLIGPDFIPAAESIIARKKAAESQEQTTRQLEATDTIASETRRLATATEELVGTSKRLVKATWGLFWVTLALVVGTVLFNLLR